MFSTFSSFKSLLTIVSPCTVSAIDKSLHKAEMLRITKWKNKMKLHKQLSEESLKSLNGECVSVPIDQYKRLLRAQQVRR